MRRFTYNLQTIKNIRVTNTLDNFLFVGYFEGTFGFVGGSRLRKQKRLTVALLVLDFHGPRGPRPQQIVQRIFAIICCIFLACQVSKKVLKIV